MGEENKQEEVKAETHPEVKKEETPEEKKEEQNPPSFVILFVDLHCLGCAKKIERSIMNFKGVEEVEISMELNQITIKGIVEPQALCTRIQKKTKRRAKILSPSPAADGDSIPKIVTSQVSEPKTVELNVNMHCEACAQQLKGKILKMRGVQSAETDLSTGKVKVTGTMDGNRLVDYVYRRTRKQAQIVPQPEPVNEKQEEKKEESAKPEEDIVIPEEKKEEKAEEKKEEEKPEEQEKKEDENNDNNSSEDKGGESKEEPMKESEENNTINNINEELVKKMMHYYPPLYMIEQIPAPQLFSDENPNACCIS